MDNDANISPTKAIRAINNETVHRICSGQVVFSLAIAVKELLENAIDAGAKTVEIRLKEYGSEAIEVIDNGSGVEECNFEALTLKHHTSKLSEFSDLESVSTLGFRGEALSSLCALSNITIVTRHKSVDLGTKIEYDKNGYIKGKVVCPRQVGTTVTLTNLFTTLPVRHREFLKNLKREFSKMCTLLYAYCVVAEDVRIICTNQTKKGARTTIVQTQGSKNIKDNIICVFGSKQLESLIEIKQREPDEQILQDYNIEKPPDATHSFTFTGFISKCTHGSGRSTNDRQFYYINSRPCEPTKVIKLVNEVYKYFNGNQYPFVYLNIKTEQSQIDVNVTPDKRQIFMEKEKLLLATLKTTLLEMFKDFPSTLKLQNLNLTADNKTKDKTEVSDMLKKWTKQNDTVLNQPTRGVKRPTSPTQKPKGVMSYIYEKRKKIEEYTVKELSDDSGSETEEKLIEKFVKESYNSSDSEPDFTPKKKKEYTVTIETPKPEIETPKIEIYSNDLIPKNLNSNSATEAVDEEFDSGILIPSQDSIETNSQLDLFESSQSTKMIENISSQNTVINVTEDDIKNILNKIQSTHIKESQTVVKFRSELTSKTAEDELQKQITKDMFEKMSIIGQFNKGFIITQFDSDLFIVDQHATDEKYNFEMLQQNTVLQNQKLVNPKRLDLTAANEILLMENIEVFNKNGFTFEIDENAEPRFKVALTAIPVSKNWEFGKEDIDELLFMLHEDSSHENCRPSRVRAMFASRACRKSVMIGSALSVNDMRRLVDHMGQIDQPWNCPHGRPTMRHLINLKLIQD